MDRRRTGGQIVMAMALLVPMCAAFGVAADLGGAPVADAATGDVVPVVPARLLDTRPGNETADGKHEGGGPLGAGKTYELTVNDRGGVPAGADAVLLNVTAVGALAAGHLTVWPCGEPRPDPASNVNYTPGGAFPNAVLSKIGSTGRVCIWTLSTTQLVVDVNGYVPDGGGLVPVVPARLAETRPGKETDDGQFEGAGIVGAGTTYSFTVGGRGTVPNDAEAAWLNVTAVGALAAGHLTVWPCGEPRPDPASNVNYTPGGAFPNAVLSKIGDNGRVCVYSLAATHLVVDVNGYVEPGADLATSAPVRMLETRPGLTTFDGKSQGSGFLGAGKVIQVPVAGRGSVPPGATAVFMNLTAVRPEAAGHLTVYPCDEPRPDPASNVNYTAGGVFPNAVLAKLSADGKVCIYTLATTHLIADVVASTSGTPASLAGVSLDTSPVKPFDRIDIDGLNLAADLSDFGVVIDTADGEGDLPVLVDEAGPYVVAPFDPNNPGKAGSIRLRLALGNQRGPAVTIPILALPAAPGSWAEIVDTLLAYVDEQAAAAGLTRAQLAAFSFENTPDDLIAARMLLGFLDDGTDGDLGSLLTGTLFDLTPPEAAFVEAIIAQLGLVEYAESVGNEPATAADQRTTAADNTADGTADRTAAATTLPTATPAMAIGRTAQAAVANCKTKGTVINDPEELRKQMAKGVDGIIVAEGAERKVLDSIASITDWGSKLPGIYGELIGVIGTVFMTIELSEYIDSITLPTRFRELQVSGTITEFNEDFTMPGSLSGITLVAESTGGDIQQWVDKIAGAVFSTVMGKLTSYGLSGTNLAELEQHLVGQILGAIHATQFGAAMKALGPDVRPFCPEEWFVPVAPSALPASRYVTVDSVRNKFDARVSDLSYRPTEIGTDEIRVKAIAGVFSNRTATGLLPVETKPIIVDVTPDLVVLDNSLESFELTIEVHNADNPQVEVVTPVDTFVASPGQKSFNYEAPRYPHEIVVRSVSTSGLRASGLPPREDIADVQLNAIRLVPDRPELSTGEAEQMQVLDVSDQTIDGDKFTWEATGGTISTSGLYTAGNTPGTFQITATMKVDPSKIATTTVTITDDRCLYGTWELQVQRLLDDRAFGGTATGISRHEGGYERITYVEKQTNAIYPTYSIEVDLVTSYSADGTKSTFEVQGSEGGEYFVDDETGEIHYIPGDPGIYRQRLTIADEFGTEVGPWEPFGGPISQAGSVFSHGFDCGATELAMYPDGFYSDDTTFWTRSG